MLTDNETIKALKCCKMPVGSGACNGCSLKDIRNKRLIDDDKSCTTILLENALDLINRFKAKNQELEKMIVTQRGLIDYQKAEIEELNIELIAMRGAANSYKAEVERLNNEVNLLTENSISTKYPCCVLCGNGAILTKTLDDYDNLIGDISAEGIKEFWNELKARNTMDRRIISVESGDNLVKELTEGNGNA